MVGPWQRAWDEARTDSSFIDLADSRFHQNGLLPANEPFAEGFERWLAQRSYQPDSRGSERARVALSDFYAGEGWSLDPSRFLITAGTSEAYALIFSTLAESDDEVLLPRPGYPLFEQLARHSRLKTTYYDQPYRLAWQPDAESLEKAITPRTRFVVVISPNNPTGQTLTQESLSRLAEVCLRYKLIMIVDEVFDACFGGPEKLPRPGALFPDLRTLTLNGISKRFGSPDLKLAWIAVSGPQRWAKTVGDQLELANDAFLSANDYSQFLLPDLFLHMQDWQRHLRDLLSGNRDRVHSWLQSEERVSGILPRGGIHGLWRIEGLPSPWDDESWSIQLLKTKRVALHPGFFYDVQEPGTWMVYSLLKDPQVFSLGLDRLADFIRNFPKGEVS